MTRRPTKKASEAPAAVRRLHPNREPINPWQPTPIEAAIMVHDKAMMDVEGRWGVEVLETLVSPETAAKFASACQKRDAAIMDGSEDQIISRLSVVVRGLKALEEEALAAGHKPLDAGRYWATSDDEGGRWLFVQHEADTKTAAKDPRWAGYQIWSMNEVMRVLSDRGLVAVLDAKKAFPGATVTKVKPPVDWTKGDEVGIE